MMLKISQRLGSTSTLAIAGVALFGIGGAIGATAASSLRPEVVMAAAQPTPIKSLADAARPWAGEPIVTVRGQVTQLFGRQFMLNDGTGQVLVEAGRHGEEGSVAANQTITVQGRYEEGTIRPLFLVGPDGRVAMVGHGDRHGGRERWHRGDRSAENGSVRGPDGGPGPQPTPSKDAANPKSQPTT